MAGATLALQVLLTRIFAAVLYYHFGFLAISLALLGVGAGAILVYVRPAWFERRPLPRELARWAVAFALSTLLAVFVIVRLDYALGATVTPRFVVSLGAACLLSALPFLAGGIAVALAVRGWTASIGRVYAFDLTGAGIGAVAVVPLLWLVDAPTLTAALAAFGGLAALLFAGRGNREGLLGGGVAVLAVVVAVVSAGTSLLYVRPEGTLTPVADRWTPLSRVLGYAPTRHTDGLVVYDRNVGQVIRYHGGRLPGYARLQEGPQSVGYGFTPHGSALVIGGGGGRDVLAALSSGQRHVDVIELNRAIRDVVDDDLARYSGSPYSLRGVSTAIGDGRSTLAGRAKHYDQIQLGFVDTFSASSAQAFALTENSLYTVEAFREYLDHLRPGGVLNVSRPIEHVGQEALRATVLSLQALRAEGIAHPERNVVVLRARYGIFLRSFEYATVLVRRTPWRPSELAQIRAQAAARGDGVVYAPGGPYRAAWRGLAAAPSAEAFCTAYPLDVCAPTDDKPFFFNMKRLGDLGGRATSASIGVPDPLVVLAITLAILAVLCAVAFLAPLALVRGRERPPLSSLGYFAAIGVGFLALEIVLIQRFVLFLGFPTYALSVVLFALLVFTGFGSLATTRLRGDPRRALLGALGAGCGLIALATFGLQPLLRALIDLPFAIRVAVTVVLLAPAGLTLGMAMPLGLRRLSALHPTGVPWAWGVNGIVSVLSSVLAISVALEFGFRIATLLALACYLAALAHAAFGTWPKWSADDPLRTSAETELVRV